MPDKDAAKAEEPEVDVEDLDEVSEVIPYTYSITAYGADYPVDSLVTRLENSNIVVPRFSWADEESDVVGFQRDYVWPRSKADRFVESLLLGLPVPGIFLVKEPTGRLLVLDGHQRLHTLHSYYDGVLGGKEYRLEGVQDRFTGLRYKDLEVEDKRRLDDSIIHATIVRQDEPSEDQSSIYVIFERLNTGGVNLQPQEIRVALYHGELVRVLRSLNENKNWRALYGKKSKRLKDLELILRFFALHFHADAYGAPMKGFLNKYMASNRDLQRQSEKVLGSLFERTVEAIFLGIGKGAFRPRRAVNAAVVDSIMTGVARRCESGAIKGPAGFRARYEELLKNDDYLSAIQTGTSQEANVANRLRFAEEAFADVP